MGRHSRCEFHVVPRGRHPQAQLVESVLMSMMPFARRMLGTDWRPVGIWFVHQPLSGEQTYEDAFGCPVKFGMLNNAFVAATADFDRRQGAADKRVKTLVGSLLRESELHGEWSYISRCKTHLRQLLATQQVTINHLGARLGVSPAVLQRRLDGLGLCFRSLVMQVRLEIVNEEVKNGVLTEGIMGRLGFSRANAMNRFLKQHEGDLADSTKPDGVGQIGVG
jgi:AraC-like DNA-binding protein